jgi:hypothetical protein
VIPTDTQARVDPSGVAAEGGRGLAAFLVYLGTTRSLFTASTDAIWPRYRERSSATAMHCQYTGVMSGDPLVRGGRSGASDETVDGRGDLGQEVHCALTSSRPECRDRRPRLSRDTGGWAGEESEQMTGKEGAR